MNKKRALILGITGQDGSYLAEVLLEKDYEVHGMVRRTSTGNLKNIQSFQSKLKLHEGDMLDISSIDRIVRTVQPHEIYNEADQDNVGWSYKNVGYSCDITGAAVGKILDVVCRIDKSIKFFQPCSAMMFDDWASLQDEDTRFAPKSPYACAKIMAYYFAQYYRHVHGMFVATAIFYNHDSPRRTEEYLLHKICKSVVRISKGLQDTLALGNLNMLVDIGYAREYMGAAYQIMQQPKPDDFVIGSREGVMIRYLVNQAFDQVNIGKSLDFVTEDPEFYRPGKQSNLVGDCRKANKAFGWNPEYAAEDMVKLLIEHELSSIERG
jgi:GDPmannose 4,6-dehydratase